jgi:hypothetical protein
MTYADQHDDFATWKSILAGRAGQLGERAAVAGLVEILQRKVHMKSGRAGFERQWMYELRIKNQQLRRALMEMEEFDGTLMNTATYKSSEATLDVESLTASNRSWSLKHPAHSQS